MDCQTCAAFLEKYGAGKAAFSKNREVFEHIKTCKACKESMQRLLLESDAKLFQNALLARESERDMAAEVLESLPADKKGKKARPSSGRLKPHRSTKKRDRSSSSGIIKPVRTGATKARRRRRVDDSGSFFSEELFSSDKKTGGFSMVYCESCNERIDPADLEQGLAVRHEGTTYCPKCKGDIEGLEEDAAATATASPKARRSAPTRAARPARGSAQAKPLNLPLVGGGLIVAALILVVAVVALTTGKTPSVESADPGQPVKTGDETGGTDPATGPTDDGGGATVEDPSDDPGDEEDNAEIRAIRQRQKDEAAKEAKRKAQLEKVDNWIKETAEKANALIDEKKYEETIAMWGGLKEKLEKEVHTPEQMAMVDEHVATTKRNWMRAAERLIYQLREKSEKLEAERKYDEAVKVLDEFPEEWKKIPGIDEQLRALRAKKDMIKYRAKKYAERVARERMQKAHVAVEVNKVYKPFENDDHLNANWYNGGKGKLGWDKKERIVTLTTSGSHTAAILICRYKNAAEFHDYVIEFEYKSEVGLAIYFRVKSGTKPASAGFPATNAWKKAKLVVEGITAKLEVDGKTGEDVIDLRSGPFCFFAPRTGTAAIKNLSFKVTKLEKNE